MFIPNDPITEIVTHFIGHFEVRAEDLRYRSHYDQFWKEEAERSDDAEIDPRSFGFREALKTKGLAATVDYTPFDYAVASTPLVHSVIFNHLSVFVPPYHAYAAAPHVPPDIASAPGRIVPSDVEPGSTILVASQIKYLMDDDMVVVGSYEYAGSPSLESHAELAGMTGEALQFSSSLGDLADLPNVNRMLDLVEDAAAMIRSLTEDDFGPADDLFLKVADRIDGHYGNGAPVGLLPSLDDLIDERFTEPEEATQWQDSGTDSLIIDASKTPTTMNVSSGGNLSWNEAAIVNAGLAPSVMVVAGDYHRVDAIYQTNLLRDLDDIDGRWPGGTGTMGGNVVQNSASFASQDYATKTSAESAEDGFPANWNVTTVEGDMTFLSWVFQYNFTSDNDTQVLTAMGTNTFVSTGLNLGFNLLSFADFGRYFDMVIIGGSLYDGNFITQTNVLLDNDTLSVWGTSSAWQGSVETGGNLLWNEASIENVGPDAWTVGLPSHYQDAVDGLARGDREMPAGFRTDAALDGLGNLKVLYITGNVYDTHSIDQVNIVGDADLLALYEENLLKAQDSVWQVTTGANTLVNKATIVDYDSVGQTAYVGGTLYSDAVLVQAEIIEGATVALSVPGKALANEVIAFLDDPADLAAGSDDALALHPMTDAGASYDTFQSVLA